MTKTKNFDCLKLKDFVQKKLFKEQKGVSDKKIRQESKRKLNSSKSPVAELWRVIKDRKNNSEETLFKMGDPR